MSHQNGWFIEVVGFKERIYPTSSSITLIFGSLSFFLRFANVAEARRPEIWKASFERSRDELSSKLDTYANDPNRYSPREAIVHLDFPDCLRMAIGEYFRELGCQLLTQSSVVRGGGSDKSFIRDKWFVPYHALQCDPSQLKRK